MIIRYTDDEDFIAQITELGKLFEDLYHHNNNHRRLVDKYRDNLLSGNQYLLNNLQSCIKLEEEYVLERAKEIRSRFYTAKEPSAQSIFD